MVPLAAALADAEWERDLAIAHDRQPYPTAWAYEQACEALEATKIKLADAEQKLAAKSAEVERAGAQCNLLHGKIATAEYRLADAEKRAEELERIFMPPDHPLRNAGRAVTAEEFANFHRCKPPLGNPTREEAMTQNAVLTRKLATAQEALHEIANPPMPFGAIDADSVSCEKCGQENTADIIARDALAAIDVPAAEEAVGLRCADCSMPYGGAGWLDVTLPDDQWALIQPRETGGGILCANDIVRRASRLPGAEAVRAVIEFAPQRNAPPPEPANVQGSEAIGTEDFGGSDFAGPSSRNVFNQPWADSLRSAMEDDMESMTPSEERAAKAAKMASQSSPQPFTVEEARMSAAAYDTMRCHERTATTLRDYADMKERGDALERAVLAAIDAWDAGRRGSAFVSVIANLRSVLAKRTGKGE